MPGISGRLPVSRVCRSMPICSVIACRANAERVLQNPVSTKLSAIQRVLLFTRYFMISSDTISAGMRQRFWSADARAFRFFSAFQSCCMFSSGFPLFLFWRGNGAVQGYPPGEVRAYLGGELRGLSLVARHGYAVCSDRVFSVISMVVLQGNKGLPRCFSAVIRVWFSGFCNRDLRVFSGVVFVSRRGFCAGFCVFGFAGFVWNFGLCAVWVWCFRSFLGVFFGLVLFYSQSLFLFRR